MAAELEPPYLHPDYRSTVLRAPARPLVRLPEEWFHAAPGPAFGRVPVAPGDANLTRLTDDEARYRFLTVKPGAYPWRNHPNAWRPAHIHFSAFGPELGSRLVTQMYFPGDPLLPIDPILQALPGQRARDLLVAALDLDLTEPEWALGYRWDIVLRGRAATPREA